SDTVVAPATITLTALASDSDGSVVKVEYFNGQEKIGESLSHPWTFSFKCQEAGTYEIIAKASDNLSATSTSAPVKISVILKREYPDLINLYPNPNNGNFTIDMNAIAEYDEESTLAIVNLTGRTIYSDNIPPGEASRQIDIANSLSGTYILIITGRDGILTTRKFIKN
ncbi:MAG: T9SS type A sorting domain-containing protein, partial [Bacteroidales bacterium]|nr:T9SS type A sorting domain-containing protein [Bacteroidales bacterium]